MKDELIKNKKNVARSISNRRSSANVSQASSRKRYSSARSSKQRSRQPNNDMSYTIESRYPVIKKRGIGEQTPPKLDLDQYPTRDYRPNKNIRSVKINKGPKENFIRFRDQCAYEQLTQNLEFEVQRYKNKCKELKNEIAELQRVNNILHTENKIAVSLLVSRNNPNNEISPSHHADKNLDHILKGLQYVID